MPPALQLLAGPRALTLLRDRGLRAEDVDVFAAASGGPKWLVLAGLDRVVFGAFLRHERVRPMHLIGASIGSWRMACLAQRDPVAAVDRFEAAYIEQRYAKDPTPRDVSEVSARILDAVLGTDGATHIVTQPWARLHVITTLCRGLVASERKQVLLAGLALAAIANVISRRTLTLQMRRVIFDTAGDASPFRGLEDLPTTHVPLTIDNLRAVLLASGSIPLVLAGVRIPGAPQGMYRDGGVIDYHPDLSFGPGDGLVLYPHFYPRVTPGWFDKSLPWRAANAKNFERALILAPSAEFVAALPGGKIPDRNDFYRMDDAERIRAWRAVVAASKRLGDEFGELLASGRWTDRVQPLPLPRHRPPS